MTPRAVAAIAVAAAASVTTGCHPAPPARTAAVTRSALAAAGDVVAAVEQAGALYLVAPDRVTIERGGRIVATAAPPDGAWADAIVMPALDDPGAWVVARTTDGGLWRITADGELEPVHDRLGVPARARSIAAGATTVGIALPDGVAILRDRTHLARFSLDLPGGPGTVLATRDRIALPRRDHVDVWNLQALTHADYAVPGALAAGFLDPDGRGRLVVATRTAVFIEPGAGDPEVRHGDPDGLRRMPAPADVRAIAIAGSRLWVATAGGVFLLDGRAFVRARVEAAATDRLFGLAGGDLVLATPAGVTRLALERTGDDPRWTAEVWPIVERVCARCHGPGGSARVDLTTAAAWRAEHAALVHRVVETRTMPPAGTPLDEAQRRTLAEWLSH
jgi:cbb3-type cytochrome c oxidase subunit III